MPQSRAGLRRWWPLAATVALAVGAFAFFALRQPRRARPLPKGDVLAQLELPTAGGTSFDPAALRGKKVLVCFFSPSCGICAKKLPELQALADARADTELVTIAIRGRPQRLARFARARRVRAPVLLDRSARLLRRFGGDRVPWTLILDGTGRARKVLVGGHERATYQRALDSIGSI